MLSSIIIEFVTSVVGETAVELFLPRRSKPEPPPAEGLWNASLGSLAAFLAAVAAMFGAVSTIGVLLGQNDGLVWTLIGVSVVLALVAGVLAHRTFLATNRRHTLARVGLWLSRATVFAGVLAALLSVAGAVPFR